MEWKRVKPNRHTRKRNSPDHECIVALLELNRTNKEQSEKFIFRLSLLLVLRKGKIVKGKPKNVTNEAKRIDLIVFNIRLNGNTSAPT